MAKTEASVPLMEARRDFVRTRILKAAQDMIFVRGLSMTVQEIADAAGVSRPTVFRHFGTLDALLAEAVTEAMHAYVDLLPERGERDVYEWLSDVLLVLHRDHATGGPGYCELMMRDDFSGELARVLGPRRRRQIAFARRVAKMCWAGAGGDGDPPVWLTNAFGAHLSPFFALGSKYDMGLSPDETADTAARALRVLLKHALEEAGCS